MSAAPKDLWVNVYPSHDLGAHRTEQGATRVLAANTTAITAHYRLVSPAPKREAIALVVRRGKPGAWEYAYNVDCNEWTPLLALAERWDPKVDLGSNLETRARVNGARVVRIVRKR